MLISTLILFVGAFIAFSLSAVCGGGAGLLLMPAIGIFIPSAQIPASLSIGTFSSSGSRIIVFFTKIRWDVVKWFVPSATPAVFVGALLLRYLNPIYLEIIMAIFLIGNLPALFKRKVAEQNPTHSSHAALIVIGFLAGFLSGLTGAVGLLFNRFYLRYGMGKEEIVATRAANEVILHLIKLGLYASFGLLTSKVIVIGIAIASAGFISSWFMKWGLKKISELLFQKIGYASMVVSGTVMLTQSGNSLFSQNRANLSFSPISQGMESKIQWQRAIFVIEFEYNEGFEFEQVINLSDLTSIQQNFVLANKKNADRIVVEEVFGFDKHSYEAYYFNKEGLIDKIDF
jgi:uncharacterized membrane protein YfcA